MPKPPDQKRVFFPFRGASDRKAFIDTPGDLAPLGSIINVRDLDSIGSRERGGQRPGLIEITDSAGTAWGQLNAGPVQGIIGIPRAAKVTGYTLGAGAGTHVAWESRAATNISANLYILRNKNSEPYLSRYHAIGTAADFEDATDRDLTACIWTGAAALAGGVNENPFDTDSDDLIFKTSFTNGAANNGFGSPGWTTMTNWDTGSAAYSTLGGPWPTEAVSIFYGDTTLENVLFVASSVTAGRTVSATTEPLNKGYLIAYNITGTGVLSVAVGKVARLRLFGKVYNEATPGTASTLTQGTVLVNSGAIEIPAIQCKEVGGVKALYFVYDAARRGEAMVGRLDVGSIATTGLDLTLSTGGAFQTNGAAFAVRANDFTVPSNALDFHYLSVNYPRGAKPTAIDVDSDGYVYYTCSSAGEGVYSDTAAGNYRPDHHPDYPGHRPVTVCKVDPAGTRFEWEAVTNYSNTELGYTRIGDPELIWCRADDDGCYVGGRTINDANVFALNADDGGIRWKWRSGASGGSSRTYAAKLDPDDGNVWVVGDRTNTWQGVTNSKYANVWKLDKESGTVLISHDIGPGTNAISIDINPSNGLIAIGTLQTDS